MAPINVFDQPAVRVLLARLARRRAASPADNRPCALHPPLHVSTVRRHERRLGIQLPTEYRRFVTTIGDGGLGPGYGLFRLREALSGGADWYGGDVVRAFPHRRAWNLPKAAAIAALRPKTSVAKRRRVLAAWTARDVRAYSNPRWLDGAVPICHFGCGYLHWLVVTGPGAGEVWYDARECYWGIEPVLINGRRARFSAWYGAWMEYETALEQGRPSSIWWTTRTISKRLESGRG